MPLAGIELSFLSVMRLTDAQQRALVTRGTRGLAKANFLSKWEMGGVTRSREWRKA
jgi:hypothetical protein